ncbi:hypothetical protein BGZ65_003077 [Modicella reniformis]|uniref:Tetraspanin n=1 Tax=Modicella reniformis TaxID=1440133 RepID=A0A9P6LT46_9FUNG|nr:hypothetical protein BGZ65_003077 [Modicella reniformis]
MNFMHVYRHPARLYILVLNVIAMIASVGLTGVGIFRLASSTRLLLQSSVLSWSLIVLSLFIFLVSLLGCAAALTESKPVLSAYGVIQLQYGILVVLLVLLQLSLIIYALAQHDKMDDILDMAWQRAYDKNPQIIQDLETRLGCCGYSSVGDRAIPKSSKFACRESPAFGYNVSCQRELRDSYIRHETVLLGFATGIQFLQVVLALASTVALWSQLRGLDQIERQHREEYSRGLLRDLREEDQMQRRVYRSDGTQSDDRGRYGATDVQRR